MAYSIRNQVSKKVVKVEVNDSGDYIVLYPGDTSFTTRYAAFLEWLKAKEKEMETVAAEAEKKYEGRKLVSENEDGTQDIDVEQFSEMVNIYATVYKEITEKLEELFGQDVLKKFYKECYEVNPDFIPDIEYIGDFLEAVSPVLNDIYNAHFEKAKGRYNRNRKGKNTKVTPIAEEASVEDKVEKGDE